MKKIIHLLENVKSVELITLSLSKSFKRSSNRLSVKLKSSKRKASVDWFISVTFRLSDFQIAPTLKEQRSSNESRSTTILGSVFKIKSAADHKSESLM
jgi:hypothetical protein